MSFANAMFACRLGETDFLFEHIMRHTNIGQAETRRVFSEQAWENNTF
jgi:hypothetical protein